MARKWRLFLHRIQSFLKSHGLNLDLLTMTRGRRNRYVRPVLLILLFLGISILPVTAQAPSSASTAQVAESANTLVKQGTDYYDKGEYYKAIEVLQQAKQDYTGDPLNQAMVLSNLSLAYQQVGEWQEARRAITHALEQLKQSSSGRLNQQLAAQALLVKGQLELAVGQPEEALQDWQAAGTQFEQIQNTLGKHRSQLYQVLALQELGFHRQAFKTLLQLPELFQDSRDSPEKVIAYRTLGNLLRIIGFSEDLEAIEKLTLSLRDKAEKSTKSENNKIPKYLNQSRKLLKKGLEVARTEQDKSEALLGLGNTARAAYKHSQDAYYRTPTPNDKKTVVGEFKNAFNYYEEAAKKSLRKIVQTQAQLNQYSLLVDYAEWSHLTEPDQKDQFSSENIALKITQLKSDIRRSLEQSYLSHSVINARINFVKTLLRQNKTEQSLLKKKRKAIPQDATIESIQQIQKWLESTYTLAESINDVRGESYSLGYLGKLQEQSGQNNDDKRMSYINTKKALIKAEEIAERGGNAQDLVYQWQWQLGRILTKEDTSREAISAYEVAVKTLETLREDLVSFNNPDLQFSFRDSVEPVYREYVDLLLTDQEASGNLGRVSEAQETLQKAQKAIESLQVAELENFLKCQLKNTRQVPIYRAIDENKLNAATIYTIILEKRLEVILKLPGNNQLFRYTPKDSDKETVEKKLKELREAIGEKSPKDNSAPEFETVYSWVIGGISDQLEKAKVKTLVFVLDGALRNIPMAALYDGKQFLIEKYSIALNLGTEFSDRKPLQAGKFRILAAGLSKAVPDLSASPGDKTELSALPGVETELEELKSKFPSRIKTLQNEEFSAKNVQEQILQQNFDIIHLGTHGTFSSNPETTNIRVFDKELNVNEMEQILRKRTDDRLDTIGLLFLSACQTAVGDKRATLGIAGMAVRTGANSVIATLFDAQDTVAPELISAFYEELGKPNITKADALRLAQLRLLQDSSENGARKKLPRSWAPFILLGNWQ